MQKIACLYDASQAVMSTFDLDEVLAQILGILRDYFQLQNGAIALVEEKTAELYVRAPFGRKKADARQKIGEGITYGAYSKLVAGVLLFEKLYYVEHLAPLVL